MSELKCLSYGGRYLTAGEISLHKIFEKLARDKRQQDAEKLAQRNSMAQSVRAAMAHKEAAIAPTPPVAALPSEKAGSGAEESKATSSDIIALKKRLLDDAADSNNSPSVAATEAAAVTGVAAGGDGSTLPRPATTIKKRKTFADAESSDDDAAYVVVGDEYGMFSLEGMISDEEWHSRNTPEPQRYTLHDFGYSGAGKQTLGLKLSVPKESKSWSLNICPDNDRFGSNIYLHLNPRYNKQMLMMNDKQGTWGQSSVKKLGTSSKKDGLVAAEIDLMIQVRPEGFLVMANELFGGFFPHRRDPTLTTTSSGDTTRLTLIMNSHDDNGNPQEVILNKVWWGRREAETLKLSTADQHSIDTAVADQREALAVAVPVHTRTLLTEGLPVGVTDLKLLQGLEYTLFEVFEEFAPEAVAIVRGQGFAFIKLSSADQIQPAIEALNGAVLGEAAEEDAGDAGGGSNGIGEFELKLSVMQP